MAEEYGFDHAWTYDHLSWRSLADEPWYATIPTLTAAATVTDRIGLGLFVASPNYRHPVPFAKELATLDDISDGRVLLGVGSGGTGFDADVLGQPELTAAAAAREIRRVRRGARRSAPIRASGVGRDLFSGDWFVAHDARMVGSPVRLPRMPLLIAGNGPKTTRLAATRGDGWVTTGGSEEDREEWWSGVEAARPAIRRGVRGIRSCRRLHPHPVDRQRSRVLARERGSLRRRGRPRGIARLHRRRRPLAA